MPAMLRAHRRAPIPAMRKIAGLHGLRGAGRGCRLWFGDRRLFREPPAPGPAWYTPARQTTTMAANAGKLMRVKEH